MKYILKTAKSGYTLEEKTKLEKFGFKFYEENGVYRKKYGRNDDWINGKIKIDTLEELHEFINEYGPLIIKENEICIYDGWVE